MKGRFSHLLWMVMLVVLAMAILASSASADTKVIYVATTGNDSTGNGSFDNPYATIDKARQVISAAHPLQHPYEVRIRGGVYYLASTLTFTADDSGTSTCPISYIAYNGEAVTVSGGKPINLTWYNQGNNIWDCALSTAIPDYASHNIRHIWKDGVKQTLARYPNVGAGNPAGYMLTTGQTSDCTKVTVAQANVHGNWTGGEISVFGPDNCDWATNLVSISSVSGNNIYVDPDLPFGAPTIYSLTSGRRCYVRNLLCELDAVNEWFIGDYGGTGWLWVYSTSQPTGSYVVGYLQTLLHAESVSYLNFRGITFTQNTGADPSPYYYTWKFAVEFYNAHNCNVDSCTLTDLAHNALGIDTYSDYMTVKDCKISYVDACGIAFVPNFDPETDQRTLETYNLISGNEIHHTGEIYKGSQAISLRYINWNTIENNYIHDVPNYAIHMGAATSGNNVINNNEMRNVVTETADSGVIHTYPFDQLDPRNETGNVISNNLVVNAKGYYYDTGGALHTENAYAYYLDQASAGWTLHDNVARDCFGGLMFHGTMETDVYNNFWINNKWQSSIWCTPYIPDAAQNLMGYFSLLQNISYSNSGYTQWEYEGGGKAMWLSGHGVAANNNVYYANGGSPRIHSRTGALDTYGTGLATWTQWRSTYGFDATYTTADPQFQNISADDYRINNAAIKGSPYYIHDIDFALAVTAQPASSLVTVNQRATFSVGVTGPAPRYQWRKNTTPISGATQSTYVIDSVKPSDIGSYDVVVTNCRGSVTSNAATLKLRAPGDVNGDGTTDIIEWRPDNGWWNVRGQATPYTLGQTGDNPLVGDFSGDARQDAAIYRGDDINGSDWYFDYSGTGAGVDYSVANWGWPTRIPVTGDFDGDGDTDFGEFCTESGDWVIAGIGTIGNLGQNGDIPIPADYDGDGKTDMAVTRPGATNVWYVTCSGGGSIYLASWGNSGHVPICGDYNGDGKAEFAVFKPAASPVGIQVYGIGSVTIGAAGDIPLMGDYDGDGKTDYAVYHPDNSNGSDWLIKWSSDSNNNHNVDNWGWYGRVPMPAAITAWNGLITLQPVGNSTKAGADQTFTVAAQGSGLSYQWYKGGTPLSNGGRISGATSPSLTITSLVTGDSDYYKCVVTNWNSFQRNSAWAQLTVSP